MTDKTLFIHAGGSKTGSSALQNFFEINAPRLESLGFAYEYRLNIKSEYEINSGNGLLLYQVLSSATTTDNDIDSLVLSYFGQCNNAICSSECFAEFMAAHNWKKLIESSVRLGLKLKVIFYVRNVIPFLLSSYDQAIKRHGEWRLFDEWVIEADWRHSSTLRIITDELPKENVHVLHFDQTRASLFKGVLDVLGIDPSFKVDPNEQRRLVNRSLTEEERKALIKVNKTLIKINKALGGAYSRELSDLLIYANPNVQGEPILCNKKTTELLLAHYSNEVDWVNNTFFNEQAVVSVLPIEPEKSLNKKSIIQPAHHSDVEKQVLDWALEKLKTIKDETEQRLLNALNNAAQNDSEKFHPDIPADFDSLAYLLLNPDVLHAGVDPVQHFINHGKLEGRAYKFLNKQNSICRL